MFLRSRILAAYASIVETEFSSEVSGGGNNFFIVIHNNDEIGTAVKLNSVNYLA